MKDQELELDILRDLTDEVSVIGTLAKDEKSFTAVYKAFRAGDGKAYHAALDHLKLTPRCRLVCEWIRIKECVFVCLELCGPPHAERTPKPRELAEAIVRITADEHALLNLVTAVEKRDAALFKRIVDKYQLEHLCHWFCHWICVVRYRLHCRWLCGPTRAERPNLAAELRQAGQALRLLLEFKGAFDGAVTASNAGDSEKLGAIIRRAGLSSYCHFICEWFCTWRCTLACFKICLQAPPFKIEKELAEAREFAAALQILTRKPAELQRLSEAVGAGDAKAFLATAEELKLHRYCIQLCHWICALRCRRFCILVCPPLFNHPWFTHLGDFGIYADIAPATGLTNKLRAGHGGPDYGFFGDLSLRGLCPKYDPAHPLEPMAYRFLFQPAGAPVATPITGGFVAEVLVGSRYTLWNANPMTIQSVRITGAGATSPTPPVGPAGPNPPDHFIVPDAKGWVAVDAMAFDDAFYGPLMGFASAVGVPGGDPAPGVLAGTAVPAVAQKSGVDVAIIFQATRVSTIIAVNGGAAPDYTNQVNKTRINNWNEVNLIDLQEFIGPGATACSPLTNDLHILYTTDHEVLAGWSIDLVTSATIPGPPPVFPSGVGPRGAAGTDLHDITPWPSCSYLVRLHTRRSLTNGLSDDPSKWNFKTFCVGSKRPIR